ncbi:hypothetical protein HD554DRAFT_1846877 [Boletus coccyginus]|nr:hypothetical protein HD554DRAFT_1846877 [Boletus coccyginus]
MPKTSKPGPPYTDIPNEIYVVVTNPWGMSSNPRSRGPDDYKRIAAWAKFALHQAGLSGGRIPTVECIYGMGTRDEIIMQFAEGTDIVPLLGKHRWATFANQCLDPNDPRSTCVFLYNWKNNGDPANHNWTENYPVALSLDKVPAKSPYPAPSWTSPPSTLTNLVLPIPQPPIPLPILDREDNPGQGQQLKTSPFPSTVTPTPEPPGQRDEPESGEQSVAQDPASVHAVCTPFSAPISRTIPRPVTGQR